VDFDSIRIDTERKGYQLLSSESDYINFNSSLLLNCNKHGRWETSWSSLYQGTGCPKCAYDNFSGENNPRWRGGISPIHKYLRGLLSEWKNESKKSCEYRCAISGDKRWSDVHHLYSFNKILQETIQESGLEIKNMINEYSQIERELLENTFVKIHSSYGLGVCLREDIHNLYHLIYGDDNTCHQFEEFKQRYDDGEFENVA
jgi:hypothetical protein